jgi:uncharacterized LabA/DUF88 family protein
MLFIMEETILFIDGGYLSYISKYFGKGRPLKYKIEKFAINLVKERNFIVKEIYYYTAPPFQNPIPSEEENERKRNYDKFIGKLKLAKPPIIVREGRCQKIDDSFQQKGVDTLMTMDLLRVPKKMNVKDIIIITSDTDFVPIIRDIKQDGVNPILAYFTDKRRKSAFSLSNHLWKVCNIKILIRKEHFL